jgi:Histidine kinase-, DNA gyrase B-, and HSP90-like ATPase
MSAATEARLHRETFATSRAADFFELPSLRAQTGQPAGRFAAVVLKELVDNALDAAETAGVAPAVSIEIAERDGRLQLTVADNGPGMAPELVERILDFNVLVSDKAAYRSPTRGLQGNALKTIVGIPHALGASEPVAIEARGVRHEIAAAIDPAGELRIDHQQAVILPERPGTAFTVTIPAEDQELAAWRWAFGYALVNPHATVKIRETKAAGYLDDDDGPPGWDSYHPTTGDDWPKPLPTNPTSPWWYDRQALAKLVFAHVGAARQGGRDLPLREFVRTFKGLSATSKAKQVCTALPGITYLSDLEQDPGAVTALLEAMRACTSVPEPKTLGWRVDEAHYRQVLDGCYGVKRWWFKRSAFTDDGIPWVVEVAIAETIPNADAADGGVTYAVNYSPTFGDPLAQTRLSCPEFVVYGAASFLARADAAPSHDRGASNRAAVVHLICPAVGFLDKGKSSLSIPPGVAEQAGKALWSATRELYRDARRRERDARAKVRPVHTPSNRVTLKDAVFQVMPEAIAFVSDNGALPFPTRNLLYAVRPRIQALTDEELKGNYFSQTLVVQYEQEHGKIPGHYRDPRGHLHEPHTGRTVALGTREVADYQLPEHVYDKILYVEKEGFQPLFEAARLAERYDMAIASGKGQPVEAVRDLFARAEAGDYRLFVLHDADRDGYSIARTIAEETDRMPGYHVDVVDLGLTVADAIARGLETEKDTRRKELPWWMPERLNEQERAWFEGRLLTPAWAQKRQWECTRVELNALTAPELIAYIEAGLERHGASGKLIPPADVLETTAREAHGDAIAKWIEGRLAELLDTDQLAEQLADEFAERVVTDPAAWVVGAHAADRSTWWRNAVGAAVRDKVGALDGALRGRFDELLGDHLRPSADP